MIYFAEKQGTDEFIQCAGLQKVLDRFSELKAKKSTISNRFAALKKENKPLIIEEWGFKIYKSKEIEKTNWPARGNTNLSK